MDGISNMRVERYCKDGSLRVWHAYGIGPGRLYTKQEQEALWKDGEQPQVKSDYAVPVWPSIFKDGLVKKEFSEERRIRKKQRATAAARRKERLRGCAERQAAEARPEAAERRDPAVVAKRIDCHALRA